MRTTKRIRGRHIRAWDYRMRREARAIFGRTVYVPFTTDDGQEHWLRVSGTQGELAPETVAAFQALGRAALAAYERGELLRD